MPACNTNKSASRPVGVYVIYSPWSKSSSSAFITLNHTTSCFSVHTRTMERKSGLGMQYADTKSYTITPSGVKLTGTFVGARPSRK